MPDANLSDSKRKGTPGISEVLLGQSIKKPRLDMASASSVASSASAASSSRYLHPLETIIKFFQYKIYCFTALVAKELMKSL
jgi:hypothetical protein